MEQLEEIGKITIEKDGKEVECDILFTFDCDELKKTYIGYTDHSIGKNGRETIYVNRFDPVFGMNNLEPITTPEEIEMVKDVLAQIESK